MIVRFLSKGGGVSLGQAGRGGTIHNHSNEYQTVSNIVKQLGGYNISVWFTRMDNYSKMAMLSGIAPPVLMMGSRIVDRKTSTLNWTSVELSRECRILSCLPKPSFADMVCRVGDMSATCLWSCR